MSEMIPHSPPESTDVRSISKTDYVPTNPSDTLTGWHRFWYRLGQRLGFRSAILADRYAEAHVQEKELNVEDKRAEVEAKRVEVESKAIDNEIKLKKARQEAELVMMEIYCRKLQADGDFAKAQAEADKIRAETKSAEELTRIQQKADQELQTRANQTFEQAMERFMELISKIEFLGGEVEFPPAESEDEDDEDKEIVGDSR